MSGCDLKFPELNMSKYDYYSSEWEWFLFNDKWTICFSYFYHGENKLHSMSPWWDDNDVLFVLDQHA
jgi:hypothetical protein